MSDSDSWTDSSDDSDLQEPTSRTEDEDELFYRNIFHTANATPSSRSKPVSNSTTNTTVKTLELNDSGCQTSVSGPLCYQFFYTGSCVVNMTESATATVRNRNLNQLRVIQDAACQTKSTGNVCTRRETELKKSQGTTTKHNAFLERQTLFTLIMNTASILPTDQLLILSKMVLDLSDGKIKSYETIGLIAKGIGQTISAETRLSETKTHVASVVTYTNINSPDPRRSSVGLLADKSSTNKNKKRKKKKKKTTLISQQLTNSVLSKTSENIRPTAQVKLINGCDNSSLNKIQKNMSDSKDFQITKVKSITKNTKEAFRKLDIDTKGAPRVDNNIFKGGGNKTITKTDIKPYQPGSHKTDKVKSTKADKGSDKNIFLKGGVSKTDKVMNNNKLGSNIDTKTSNVHIHKKVEKRTKDVKTQSNTSHNKTVTSIKSNTAGTGIVLNPKETQWLKDQIISSKKIASKAKSSPCQVGQANKYMQSKASVDPNMVDVGNQGAVTLRSTSAVQSRAENQQKKPSEAKSTQYQISEADEYTQFFEDSPVCSGCLQCLPQSPCYCDHGCSFQMRYMYTPVQTPRKVSGEDYLGYIVNQISIGIFILSLDFLRGYVFGGI